MDSEEHEVYGSEIPFDANVDADVEVVPDEADKKQSIDDMQKRLGEMELEANVENEMDAAQASSQANKEEVDARSVFVGNVDYSCTPEEIRQQFQSCGTVNRVTLPADEFGQPKGFAYVEFLEKEAVQKALQLNDSELHGRRIKVAAKRTNVPGMKLNYLHRFNPYTGRPYMPPYFFAPYGYGKYPRIRRSKLYRPYH